MNEEKHWNGIATRYEDEIFDVFRSDRNKILPFYFNKYGTTSGSVIDFGCGIGKAFPYLSPMFREVLAIDISEECISRAKERGYGNVSFKRADLTRSGLKLPPSDFIFCCNVIMLPEIKQNAAMIRNLQKSLKKGGAAVIVVPSFESIFYSSFRLMEWYRREGVGPKEIPEDELAYYRGNKLEMIQGIMKISGVPTKHYLQPELEVLFRNAGLTVISIEKVEYNWNSEFARPPVWLQSPYPWDWLVECRKD